MGTRATIKFTDGEETYFAYRGHDGYPENVEADIKTHIETCKNRWSGAELGCFVSLFLAKNYIAGQRLPNYELTQGFHGDESYRYFVTWDGKQYIPNVE